MLPLLPFFLGVIVTALVSIAITIIRSELHKKRALAFTKKFSVLAEGLSSLKALAFRASNQLKKARLQIDNASTTEIVGYFDSMIYIFEKISAGMLPPTEEIAMSALKGHSTSAEQRAYEDSVKFRDDTRQICHQIDKEGISGLGKYLPPKENKSPFKITVVDEKKL